MYIRLHTSTTNVFHLYTAYTYLNTQLTTYPAILSPFSKFFQTFLTLVVLLGGVTVLNC